MGCVLLMLIRDGYDGGLTAGGIIIAKFDIIFTDPNTF